MSKKTKKKAVNEPLSSRQFKIGDLVAAKLKGHPVWPAKIESVDAAKRKYTVRFFGGNEETSQLPLTQLKHFRDLTKRERSCKRKGFADALELCTKEYESQAQEEPDDEHEDEGNEEEKEDSEEEEENGGENIEHDKREKALAKLREKLARKLEEKEAKKNEQYAKKLVSYVENKLIAVQPILERLHKALDNIPAFGPRELNELTIAVRKYEKVFNVLLKCIEHLASGNVDMSNVFQKTQKAVSQLAHDTRSAKEREDLPLKLRKQVRRVYSQMRAHESYKKFVLGDFNGYSRNAMIERKENDVQ